MMAERGSFLGKKAGTRQQSTPEHIRCFHANSGTEMIQTVMAIRTDGFAQLADSSLLRHSLGVPPRRTLVALSYALNPICTRSIPIPERPYPEAPM